MSLSKYTTLRSMQSNAYLRPNGVPEPDPEPVEIIVEPAHFLEFVCTKFQTMASLRILIKADIGLEKYYFEIKATNKEDYKVSQPQGELGANNNKIIYFYLKQSAPINQNLRDKFLLIIKDNRGIEIFQRKFSIIIESALQKSYPSQSAVPQFSAEPNNMTRFMSSVYTSPGPVDITRLYQHKSDLRDTFLPPGPSDFFSSALPPRKQSGEALSGKGEDKELRPSLALRQSRKSEKMGNSQVSPGSFVSYDPERLEWMREEERQLKEELDRSIQRIEDLKRRVLTTDNENKSNQARARFRIYLTVVAVILAFLLGMWIKSLNLGQELETIKKSVREKIWESPELPQDLPKPSPQPHP